MSYTESELSLFCVYLQIVHQQFVEGRIRVKVDEKTLIISNFNP